MLERRAHHADADRERAFGELLPRQQRRAGIDRVAQVVRQAVPIEGQPEDVANSVLFFASARSGFVTGDFMYVTGGMYQLW